MNKPRIWIAETIAIGSELLLGGRLDTNSLFIADQLAGCGIELRYKTTVGDDLSDIVDALKTAMRRSRIVIITGGLGPTVDDVTREAVAKATGTSTAGGSTLHPAGASRSNRTTPDCSTSRCTAACNFSW